MPDPIVALLIGLALVLILLFLFWPNGGLIGLIQRLSQLSNRVLLEDALKNLYKPEQNASKMTLESLAGALQISTNRAANLFADLQQRGLVIIESGGFQLTQRGRDQALRIIRAHRLWERYLAEETGYDESQWHNMAERLEHQVSMQQVDVLAAQLGNPTHDPHGDPIPTAEGELVPHGGQPLTAIPLDTPMRIVHIEDEPITIYAQLAAEGLHPGMRVQLIETSPTRVRFWADGDEHVLAPLFAGNISVTPIDQEAQEEPCLGEPLNNLQPGEQARVVTLSPRLRGVERRRMMDLGILPGTVVLAEMVSPGGDPTAYRIRGTLIALRQEQAQLICIQRLPETIYETAKN